MARQIDAAHAGVMPTLRYKAAYRLAFSLVWIAVLTGVSGYALSGALDRPLNDRPTVRSEINRGADFAFYCGSTNRASPLKETKCMLDAMQREPLKHPDFRPFQLGVFWGGCLQLQAEFRADYDLRKKSALARHNLYLVKQLFPMWVDGLRKAQEITSISDFELIEAGGDKGADAANLLRELRTWKSSPHPEPLLSISPSASPK